MNITYDQSMFIIIFLIGLLLFVGQIAGWKIIADPPENLGFYSHSVLNKLFGKKFLKFFNILLGTLLMILAVWGYVSIGN